MATARKKESFQLPLKNKFSLLSQNLQAINDTETSFNVNAPEYVPMANRQVKQKGQITGQMYTKESTTTIESKCTNVKAPLICSDVTNSNASQKVRLCNNSQGVSHAN